MISKESVRLYECMNKLVGYIVVERNYFWTKYVIFCMRIIYTCPFKILIA